MAEQWIGKLAVVSGASSGIGKAICLKLVQFGINVVGLARRANLLEELSKETETFKKGKFHPVKCDITKEKEILQAFEAINKIGVIHILINNAGINLPTTLYNGDVSMWKKTLDVNIIGTCLLSKEAIKFMSVHGVTGQIINIGSILGHFTYPIPLSNIYPASKAALVALTETLRLELIGINSKIKLSSISPGPVAETEMGIEKRKDSTGNPAIKYYLKPDDVANAVMYVLTTAPHFHVAELMLRPVGEAY